MTPIPSGTVTFLFTDIEGSTRLWQEFPDAMGAALSRHRLLIETSIDHHRGYLFQVVGDGCCAAFADASDALAAALEAQRALLAQDWQGVNALRVRMALHTGAAEFRTGELRSGEYVSGVTLNRVSLILSAGHGEQVLLSLPTAELIRNRLPEHVSLRELGQYLLRDLAQPQRPFQLVAPGLRAEFPALKALDSLPHNLPVQLTSFIGRDSELRAIRDQFQGTRLLTLSGAGGSGKTRLSIQTAASVVDEFSDGAWFVELAPLADATFLPTAVLRALGLREEGLRKPEDVLVDYLKNKSLLLVVDNCEHMIAAVARLAHQLLVQCPAIKLLATTREALGIPGELVFPVRPLALPAPSAYPSATAERMSQYESVRLFIDRATTVHPSFCIDNQNALAVAEICIRLDGLPLAIELAAARAKVLSPQQILARLNDRFRLLTSGSRTATPRQQTLRAAIDWSFDLLPANEASLLRRLSVFAGGCTLDAAEAVATGDEVDGADVLELLSQLINKSLVVARDAGETLRYYLLESVRQYGREKLVHAGEGDLMRDRHLDHFRALGEVAEPRLLGAGQLDVLKEFETEWDNMRAAMDWAASAPRPLPGLRLVSSLGRYWAIRGDFIEGRHWLHRMLATPDAVAPTDDYAWALYFEGYLAWFQADLSATQRALSQSVEMARASGNRRCEAYALDFQGVTTLALRDFALVDQLLEESLVIMREVDDRWGVAFILWHSGLSYFERHDQDQALRLWEQSLELFQSLGDRSRSGILLRAIGLELINSGNSDQGIDLLRQSLQISVERRAKFQIANDLWVFGEVAERDMQPQCAEPLLLAAIGVYDSIGSLRSAGSSLIELDRARLWFARHKAQVDAAFAEGRIPGMAEAVERAMKFQPTATAGSA